MSVNLKKWRFPPLHDFVFEIINKATALKYNNNEFHLHVLTKDKLVSEHLKLYLLKKHLFFWNDTVMK